MAFTQWWLMGMFSTLFQALFLLLLTWKLPKNGYQTFFTLATDDSDCICKCNI
jgi:hypothetical protein